MAITMRYLSSENRLTSANCLEDIPKTAQFIWCDFNQPTEAENTFLKHVLTLINLKLMIQ